MSDVLVRGVNQSILLLLDELASEQEISRNDLLKDVLEQVACGKQFGEAFRQHDKQLKQSQKVLSELVEVVSEQTRVVNQFLKEVARNADNES